MERRAHDPLVGDPTRAALAADERAGYVATDTTDAAGVVPAPDSPDPEPAADIRHAVAVVRAAVTRLRAIVDERTVSAGGELGGLAERHAGLPLESLLALETNITYGDRRFLIGVRDVLRHLPNVAAAFDAGLLGWGQVRAIVSEARPLTVELRGRIDARFVDVDELSRLQADEVVDRVAVAAAGLRQDLERKRTVARQQRRYVHVQESFDGGLRGNFDLPAEDGAVLLEALAAASARPTGDRDVTVDGLVPPTPTPTTPPPAPTRPPAMSMRRRWRSRSIGRGHGSSPTGWSGSPRRSWPANAPTATPHVPDRPC